MFALLALGQRFAPGAPTTYGVWFVVVFAWIGFWYPPKTGLAFLPMAAVAYVAPFIGVASTPDDAISSVAIALPAGVFLGEVIARKMQEIQHTQDGSSRPERSSSGPTSPTTSPAWATDAGPTPCSTPSCRVTG